MSLFLQTLVLRGILFREQEHCQERIGVGMTLWPIGRTRGEEANCRVIMSRSIAPPRPTLRPRGDSRFVRPLTALVVLLTLAPSPGPAKPPVVRVPFRSVESMILVEGKVNGDPVTFLLDTGSVGTIVSTRMCRITCFSLRGVQRNADGHGINGESISVRLDLQLGNRQWAGQRVSIMNLDELSSILGVRHVDGLIGEDILRDFRSIRIDYHARVIELEE
jgi:hypothetical protein